MAEQGLPEGGSLLAVYRTLFLDLPLAGIRQALEGEKQKEAVEAAWKNYDEGVRLATAAIDNLYRNPYFGEAVDRTLQEMLRWQQLSGTVTEAFLAGLRLTIELPTATEVRALLKELRTISVHHSQTPERGTRDGQRSHPPRAEFTAPVPRSLGSPEHEPLTTDLLDYFEPVGWNAAAPADSERAQASAIEDCSAYFEPVTYPVAPALSAKPQKRISHIHIKTKARAVKTLRPRQTPTVAPVRATDADDTQSVSA